MTAGDRRATARATPTSIRVVTRSSRAGRERLPRGYPMGGRLLCYACVHWLVDVNSSAAREALGSELRRMREVIGLSGMAVAAELQWSQSKVSRIEAGRLGVSLSDLSALLRTYGASEEVTAELLTMAAAGGGKAGAWIVQAGGTVRRQGEVAAIEARVHRIRQYSLTTVPGLLQSPAYTAAMARVGNFGDPAALVKARAARQSLLGSPAALNLR